MSGENFGTSPINPVESQSAKILRAEEASALQTSIAQEASEDMMNSWADEAFNPVLLLRRAETIEVKTRRKGREEETDKTEKKKILEVQKLEEVSEQYSRKNPELLRRTLLLLRSRISPRDTKEEILRKVLETYPDYSLADEALDYLIETSEGELANLVRQAKEDLNTSHGREVRAGKNIAEQARAFSAEGLGSPTGLRDMYRDITGNPRDAPTLFSELASKFDFEKLKTVINFLLHSLGSDLKSSGPSILRAELHRLMTESRNLMAILWVYRFFLSRMNLMRNEYQRRGQLYPIRLTFELLAKAFVQYLTERYPSMDKVLQLALKLGISSDLIGELIIFTQMRDAVRGVAPRLFRNEQHRHDVLLSFIEALEELEEKLEEEEEKEEKEEEE